MKNIKILLISLLTLFLAACGGSDDASTDSGTKAARGEAETVVREAESAVESTTDEIGGTASDLGDEVSDVTRNAADSAAATSEAAAEAVTAAAEQAKATADEAVTAAEEAVAAGAAAVAAGAAAVSGEDAGPCDLAINVGDNIAYDKSELSVPASCESVTVTLTHTGTLPREAMGHNWVLVPTDALNAIGTAGTNAGIENDYVPDDERIVAHTPLVGGGESASVTFALADLEDGVAYSFMCTYPGHWYVMKGTFIVE